MHTYIQTYLGPTYYGLRVCMDTYMLEYFKTAFEFQGRHRPS